MASNDLTRSGKELLIDIKTALISQGIKQKGSSQRAHFTAINNWLGKHKPSADTSNLEQVRGYLEAFYHLVAIEAWEEASKILLVNLITPTNEKFHSQLNRWGYYDEQIELCNTLLNKVSAKMTAVLESSLSGAFSGLGDYAQAIIHEQKSLKISQQIDNYSDTYKSLGNIGTFYLALGDYQQAINYQNQSLEASVELKDRSGEAYSLGRLGQGYFYLGEYSKAIRYYHRGLKIAREIQDLSEEVQILGNLSNAYLSRGEYSKTIEYQEQNLLLRGCMKRSK